MSGESFKVVVVGAGIGGLFMADVLKRAGIDFVVFEKAKEVGGTWRDNTYPGLYVDVLSRQYEFPFRPNYDWSRKYAPGTEIQDYVLRVTQERDLRRHIRFEEEIVAANFSDGRWHLKTAKGEDVHCDVFIAATGFLHKPLYPDIPGRETFEGPSFHSSAWDHSIPYAGKRWGIVGGGASGIQITEALAWEDCKVTQYIRRPQWIHIRENPKATLWERLFLRLPFAYQYRQKKLWEMIVAGDKWRLEPGPARKAMEQEYRRYLEAVRDPELRRKLTPDYQIGCVRIPKSDRNYYEAVQKPNVTLEFERIARILPDGVELADGRKHQLDVLVYATGFDTHAYMRPMQVTGVNSVTLDELWAKRIFSYAGVGLPGFPNLFMLFGPFSPVNNVPVPMGLDQEIGFIMQLIERAKRTSSTIAPTAEATDRFVERLEEGMPNTTFVACSNWYSDKTGTPILWPYSQDDHKAFLSAVNWDDFEVTPVRTASLAET